MNKNKHIQNEEKRGRLTVVSSLFMLLIFLFSFNLVLAEPPFQQSEKTVGLILETGILETHKLGEDFYIHVHVYNSSNGLLVTQNITCYYHFYNHQIKGGEHIDRGILSLYGMGYENYTSGSLINETGKYSVLSWCNSTTEGGFIQYSFDVNNTGSNGSMFFLILIISIAIIFFLATLFVNEEFFVYISGVLFLVGGIYLMINGIDIMNDWYTRTISYVFIGIGFLFTIGAYIFNSYYKKGEDEEY